MGLFNRRKKHEPIDLSQPVDWDAARRAAELVNAGDIDGASRICEKTANPRHTALAAFRFIDPEES